MSDITVGTDVRNWARKLRNQAASLELAMVQRGPAFILLDAEGAVAHTGDITATDAFLAAGTCRPAPVRHRRTCPPNGHRGSTCLWPR